MRRLRDPLGCLLFLVFIFGPGFVLDYFLHSAVWMLLTPPLFIIGMLLVAAFGPKKKLTPEQFADRLEKHFLGTENPYDWDDTTSITLADERLAILQQSLGRFDLLDTEEKRDELRRIIEAMRHGEVPIR
ncbi:MAG TPA: hypothetical protein VE866_08410 [Candidatus Binatia bacterium]|nr:hypothetical protein [Candidatus Binatia bacterium]